MRRIIGLLCVMSFAMTGCGGERVTFADQLLDAVNATSVQPRTGTLVDEVVGGSRTTVEVTIEDDFRYDASWSVDGDPVYREVVLDDALAARAWKQSLVLERLGGAPDALDLGDLPAQVGDALAANGGGLDTIGELAGSLEGAAPASVQGSLALSGGSWVIDQVGAPPRGLQVSIDSLGADPIVDAVYVLDLIVEAVDAATDVSVWDQDAIEYRPDEDPFRAPDQDGGSPETRFDIEPPLIPSRTELSDPSAAAAFTPAMLSQMAVYTRGGVVTEFRLRIGTSAVYERVENAIGLNHEGSAADRSQRALDVINQTRAALGLAPIVARDVTVTFWSVGDPQTVTLPVGTIGSLAFLANRGSPDGRIPVEPGEEAGIPTPVVATEP